MSQRCPVCKTPLWTDDVLARRLKCPRCGAEFRPTVSWLQFRAIIFVVLVAGFGLLVFFTDAGTVLVGVVFVVLVFFFFLLPRFIELIEIPSKLSVAEGPADDRQLRLEYQEWSESEPEYQPGTHPGHFTLVLALVGLLLLLMFLAHLGL